VRHEDEWIIPATWKFEEINTDGQLLVSKTVSAFEVTINKPIPAGLFELEFPQGTKVSDQRKEVGKYMLIGPGRREYPVTPQQLSGVASAEELLTSLQRGNTPFATGTKLIWFLAVAAVGIGSLVTIYWIRRRRTHVSA
jgi:hypothetical protein